MSLELWKQFNLGKENPDKAGGWFYAMRYTSNVLREKQMQIARILDGESDLSISEGKGESLSVISNSGKISRGVISLLEENSNIFEALEFKKTFGEDISIEELSKYIHAAFLSVSDSNKGEYYNYFDIEIRTLLSTIKLADTYNNILNKKERKHLQEAQNNLERLMKVLNGGYVIIG